MAPRKSHPVPAEGGYLRALVLQRDRVPDFEQYPYSIPAIRALDTLPLHPRITYLVGENGSGKSTLLEAIAVQAGFNPEGGSRNFAFATRSSESTLGDLLLLEKAPHRWRDGYFFRAESYFNLATNIEELDRDPEGGGKIINYYGGVSLHEQSHGESFIALVTHRFAGNGLYLLDEPEAALSPSRQLALLARMWELVARQNSQFIIATHSPILMAAPDALIYHCSERGIEPIAYEETEHYRVTRDFLNAREVYLRHLCG